MKLALSQWAPCHGATEADFDRIGSELRAAAAAGASMLVLPELLLPGYNHPSLHQRLAEPRDGAWMGRIAGLCRAQGCGLTLGWAERDGDRVFNAATAFDAQGALLGHYRKIQLFGEMEKAGFHPGDTYTIFDLEGVRTALLICYDIEFAPHVRALAARGVKLILVPTANPTGFEVVARALVPARAAEMGLTIAYANYCGSDGGLGFGGLSCVAGPDGATLAAAGRGEALVIVELSDNAAPPPLPPSPQLHEYREIET